MSLAIVFSRACLGIEAPLVTVEVHLSGGLPRLSIVGLPETAVRESKDRVRSALLYGGFDFPDGRITVNLAPADLPKEGGRFDLPIAIGILCASGQLAAERLAGSEMIGELALTGALRPVRGALCAALAAARSRRALIVPGADAAEAALASATTVFPAEHLLAVCEHVAHARGLEAAPRPPAAAPRVAAVGDLTEVRGQQRARRALEIAAAGEHNLLLVGPPGTGKTMLATRLGGILPPMSEEQALASAAVWSTSALGFDPARWAMRPFRAPHHSASSVALVGGGSQPRPGEISLAHHGVLFLDELPEFDRRALEVLRDPLESGRIVISRAARQTEFPARFQLIAAMNPCPCGHLGDPAGRCRCSADQVQRYRSRISGPLLDRIDLHVEVSRAEAWAEVSRESSHSVRRRVVAARNRRLAASGCTARDLRGTALENSTVLDDDLNAILGEAVTRLGLSLRARDRALRVARTIADLDSSREIRESHLLEALSYRQPAALAGYAAGGGDPATVAAMRAER